MAPELRRSILLVDDSSFIRQQLRSLLEEDGFEVLEADNGQNGLAVAQGQSVDLMIVDVNMPGMDGIEMISKVRELKHHKTTPICVLTTESGAAAAKRGKEAGATAWIVKPFKPQLLLSGVRRLLGLPSAASPQVGKP